MKETPRFEPPRFEDLFAYLEAVRATGRLKKNSIDLARSTLKRVLDATDVTIDTVLDDVDVNMVKEQLEDLDISPATAEAYVGRLRRTIKDARAWAAGEPLVKVDDKMIEYPLQLRPDLRLTITLPGDLTPGEAARIGRFVESLAIEEV